MPSTCDACSGRWPDPADRIVDLEASVAYLHADPFFPAWTVLVLRRHATELLNPAPAEAVFAVPHEPVRLDAAARAARIARIRAGLGR